MPAPTQMSSAMANLAEAFKRNTAFTATINDGTTNISKPVTIDVVDYEIEDGVSGAVTQYKSTDFIIKWTDWDFGAGPVEPKRGDTIAFTDEFSVARTYEVNFLPNENVYQREPYGHLIRVHTKEK